MKHKWLPLKNAEQFFCTNCCRLVAQQEDTDCVRNPNLPPVMEINVKPNVKPKTKPKTKPNCGCNKKGRRKTK